MDAHGEPMDVVRLSHGALDLVQRDQNSDGRIPHGSDSHLELDTTRRRVRHCEGGNDGPDDGRVWPVSPQT